MLRRQIDNRMQPLCVSRFAVLNSQVNIRPATRTQILSSSRQCLNLRLQRRTTAKPSSVALDLVPRISPSSTKSVTSLSSYVSIAVLSSFRFRTRSAESLGRVVALKTQQRLLPSAGKQQQSGSISLSLALRFSGRPSCPFRQARCAYVCKTPPNAKIHFHPIGRWSE